MSLSLNELLSVESACDLSVPIETSMPRWQRKALSSQTPSLSASALGATPKAVRLFPDTSRARARALRADIKK